MDLNAYLSLPYTRILKQDDEGQFIATIAELPGCMADGQTEVEALNNLKEIQSAWITAALKADTEIPLPQLDDELPSGKWVQRVPRALHARLVATAKEDDISLNQLVISFLAEGLATRTRWRTTQQQHQVPAHHHQHWGSPAPYRTFGSGKSHITTEIETVMRTLQTSSVTSIDEHRPRHSRR